MAHLAQVTRARQGISPPDTTDRPTGEGRGRRRSRRRAALVGLALGAALLGGLFLFQPALAATFVVNSTADAVDTNPGDGVCATSAGECTLRAAIQEANETSAADTIQVPAGTYRITIPPAGDNGIETGDFDVTRPLTIAGAGAGSTILDGGQPASPGATGLDRLLEFHPTAGAVTVNGVALQGGWGGAEGGALYNASNGTVRLVDSILRDSVATDYGGGIYNLGTLIVERSTVSGNATEGEGGGIFTDSGTLTVTGTGGTPSRIVDNTAATGGGIHHGGEPTPVGLRSSVVVSHTTLSGNHAEDSGGALFNEHEGSLTLSDATVSGNVAVAAAGGVHSGSKTSASISRVTFADNVAEEDGGGAFLLGSERPATITDSTFSRNSAGGDGGSLLTEGQGSVTIQRSTFEDSTAVGEGGGVYIDNNGPVSMTDSTVRGNRSDEGGGGIQNAGMRTTLTRVTVTGNTTPRDGGGIESQASDDFNIVDSNIFGNTAENGGGIANAADGRLLVSRSAVYNNRARVGNEDDTGLGGGIYVLGDAPTLVENTTVSGNVAQVRGGGVHVDADAGVSFTSVTITNNSAPIGSGVAGEEGSINFPIQPSDSVVFRNSIVAGNRGGPQCSFALGSTGGNIDSSDSCYFRGPFDRVNADPGLDAIADNGGPTPTHALRTESLAVDAGVSPCLGTDQRGVARPQNGLCDSGAYEFEGPFLPADTTPPDTEFLEGPILWTENTSVFRFTGTDDVTPTEDLLYQCKLVETEPDEPPEIPDPTEPVPPELDWQPCDTPWEVQIIEDGWWVFEVRAIDRARNVDPTPAVHEFSMEEDFTPPDTFFTETPPDPSFGRSAAFSFGGTDNQTPAHLLEFECRIDSTEPEAWLECTNPTVFSNLTTGQHTVEVRAVDLADNIDPTPARYTWTVAEPQDCDAANVTLTAVADGWVDQGTPSQNYVLDQQLVVRSDAPAANARALFRFDLPDDAPDCTLESATLRLYAGSATPDRTLQALPITGSWTEGGLTWNNQPATAGNAATTASGDGHRDWDVTEHVLDALDGAPNFGWLIRDAAENDPEGADQAFASRETPQDPPPNTLPRLVLRYDGAGGPPPEPGPDPTDPTAVTCGQVLKESTLLANDLIDCPGEGLVIGAPNIVVDLGGHTITSGAPFEPGEEDGLIAGIRNAGHANVVIRNGTVSKFGYGVRLFPGTKHNVVEDMTFKDNILVGVELVDADDGRNGNTVRDNTFDGNETGVTLVDDSENSVVVNNTFRGNVGVGVLIQDSGGHRVEDNDVNGVINNPALDSDGGIRLEGGRNNLIVGNTVTDTGDGGIILEAGSNNNRIEGNTGIRAGDAAVTLNDSDRNVVTGNVGHQMADAGIVLNQADETVIRDNDVRFNPAGIEIEGSDRNEIERNDASDNHGDGIIVGSGLGNRIADNTVSSNKGQGIVVEQEATGTGPNQHNVVDNNTAISNLGDGIEVAAGPHWVGNNAAHHNDGWGITAEADVVDGGGNTASGNAEPEQCRGVVCNAGDGVPPIAQDITPPQTLITEAPPDPSQPTVTFRFTGTDDRTPPTALRFECRLDPRPDPPPPEPDPPDPGEDPEPVDPTDPDSWTECVSPLTYEMLEVGEHRFEVRAIDASDNTDYSGSAFHVWTVVDAPTDPQDDGVPPNTTIFEAPEDPSTETTATFRFRGSDNATPGALLTYECRLDSGDDADFEPCTSPTTYEDLDLGEHTFEVRAVDLAGNADPTPATHTWTIEAPPPDHTPPDTTIDSGPDPVTVDTSATFEFSGTDDLTPSEQLTFECALDDEDFTDCSSPVTYGGLDIGEHTFRVRATDRAGNTDPTPATYSWTVGDEPVETALECGDVLTQSTRLVDDLLDCPEDGLVIGADSITVDLAGHTIDGVNLGAGIRNDGFDNVTITGGTIQEFDYGVALNQGTGGNIVTSMMLATNQDGGALLSAANQGTNGNTLRDSTITGSTTGILVTDGTAHATLRNNTVVANPGDGVHLLNATNARVVGNLIAGSSDGSVILEAATDSVVANNTIAEGSDAGVVLFAGSHRNEVRGNSVTESEGGIIVEDSNRAEIIDNVAHFNDDIGIKLVNAQNAAVRGNDVRMNSGGIQMDGSTDNLIEGNDTSQSNGVGIELGDGSVRNTLKGNQSNANDAEGVSVGDFASAGNGNLLDGNTASGNGATGIDVSDVGHVIANNTANDNDGWGIYAKEGTTAGINVDGGGNRAMNNKELEQCFGVVCDGGPPLPSDQVPPETTIIDGPADPTLLRTATFTFTGTDNATPVTFECRLDDDPFAPCTSPQTYTDLALGTHIFEVRAIDWSGNVDESPASWTWTIEAPPPGVPPDTTIDSGPDPTTVSTEATFTFSANEPDVTFECSLDGAAFTDCTSPATYTGLAVGDHTFMVRATDDEGLTDATPATWTWTITPAPVPAEVACGQTLTQSTLVTNDLTDCPGDGLVIGANGITVDLGGRTIDGIGQGAGVRNDGFDNVTLTGGTLREFDHGIHLGAGTAGNLASALTLLENQEAGIQLLDADGTAGSNTIRANTVTDNELGIYLLDGTANAVIRDNTLTTNAAAGIRVENSTGNRIEGNTVTGSSDAGVELEGSSANQVVANTLSTNNGGIAVLSLDLPSDGNSIRGNTVTGSNSEGVLVEGSDGTQILNNTIRESNSGAIVLELANDGVLRGNQLTNNDGGIALDESSGNLIESNLVSANLGTGIALQSSSFDNDVVANGTSSNAGEGIYVADSAPAGLGNLIDRNSALSNAGDGINVSGGGHTISNNTANFNDGWGIYAEEGNIDGGGNRATGNAEPAQCFNIACEIGTHPGAPDTEIVMRPDNPSNSQTATFTFTGTDDTTQPFDLDFECRLDSTDEADWVECENPQIYTNLAPGEHTFEVRAIDLQGNVDPTPATWTWVYEPLPSGVAPDTFIDIAPPLETTLFEGFFTFSSNEPDVTFECMLDDGPWEPCEFVYEFEFLEHEVGLHTFQVRAIDFEGNVDPTPATHTWRILGLVTTITSGPAFIEPEEPGEPAQGGETEETTATFEFHANVPDATFECSLDLGPFQPCVSGVTYTNLAVGEHLFRVIGSDPEGELFQFEPTEYEWEVVLTLDTEPPDTEITLAPADGSSDTVFEFTGTDDRTFPEALEFECRLDSTDEADWQSCLSPFNLVDEWPDFAPGPHTFEVRAVDEEDNVDPTPAVHTWTSVADSEAPDTTILSGPPDRTGEIDFTFEFAGADNATPAALLEFECELTMDGDVLEPWEPCDSPHDVQGLEPGTYELAVRATDLDGNVDPTPATWTWTVVGAPETTIDSGPDELIDVRSATFEFSSDQTDVTFECSLDGSDFLSCTSPHVVASLSNDEHTFEVRAVNEFGLVDETPAEWVWTVEAGEDTEVPETSILQAPTSPSPRTVTFTFTGLDDATPTAELDFECSVDGSDFVNCESPYEVTGLADGEHTFEVRAIDEVGNVDPTPASHTWTVDGPPTTTILSGPEGETELTTATFTFEADEPGVTFQCWLDGPLGPCESGISLTGLTPGREYVFGVRATDAAGNLETEWVEWEWDVVASEPPQTTITAGPAATTPETSATFEFTGSDNVTQESEIGFECSLDGADFAPCESPVEVTGLALGPHTFSVRAIDAAGNVDPTPATYQWTVGQPDTTPPETMINSGPDASSTSTSATFTFSSSEAGSTFECSLDGAAFAPCTSPAEYIGLQAGSHTFQVRAIDPSGNLDPTPASYTWTIASSVPPPSCDTTTTVIADADAWVDQGSPSSNKGTDSTLKVMSKGPSSNLRALVRFPLPTAAPQGCEVDSATLRMYAASFRTGRTLQALQVAAPWTEGGVTWTNQPGTTGPAATTASGAGWREWNVTSQVQGMLSGANHGFLIRDSVEGQDHEQQFHSREKSSERPELVIRYAAAAPPPDTTPPETLIGSGPPSTTTSTSATFTFSSNEADSTFECSLDIEEFGACTSPATYEDLAVGAHTFRVRATDAAGNTDPTPASYTWTVEAEEEPEPEPPADTEPPETTIDSGPDAVTTETSATFTFSSDEAGSTFECSLDEGDFEPCESPATYTDLVPGDHTFAVRATDAAGNLDETPATYAWTVEDEEPEPEPPVDSDPPETTIDSQPDAMTTDTTATFAFSSDEADSTFECLLEPREDTFADCVSPKVYEDLEPGSYTFEVRATDAAGNTDPTPASYTWVVEAEPEPEPPADTDPPVVSIDSGPDAVTTETSATFAFSADEDAEFECALDEGDYEACASPVEYSGLSVGEHTFRVRATDAAANTSDPVSYSWVVEAEPEPEPPADTEPPETTLLSWPNATTVEDAATFTFAADEEATFECRLSPVEEDFTGCVSPKVYEDLEPGSYTFEVRATDAAGNTSDPVSYSWVVEAEPDPEPPADTDPPVVTLESTPDAETTETSATFAFSADEDATFECSLDGTAFAECASPKTYTGLSVGEHTFRVRATDAAGNTSDPVSYSWVVEAPADTTPPQTTITSGPDTTTAETSATFTFSSDEPGSTFECALDTQPFEPCSSPKTYTDLAGGAHTFHVRATDTGGNTDPTPATYAWTVLVDTTPPVVTIGSKPAAETEETEATFTFSADEDAEFECSLDGTAFAECASPKTYTGLGVGEHSFRVRATDVAGNTSDPVSYSWTVVAPAPPPDTTPPVVTIGSKPAAETEETEATFTFSADEDAEFECSLDGAAFAGCVSPKTYTGLGVGEHSFRVRATDAAGNTSDPVSYSWTVVAPAPPPDTTPPVVTITSVPESVTSDTTATFSFSADEDAEFECSLDETPFDDCSSPKTYTGLGVGAHTFRVRATDAAGNTSATVSHEWTVITACTGGTVTLGADADAWVLQSSPDQNYATDAGLRVDSRPNANSRALVRFELPALPDGCDVVDAKLRLFASSHKGGQTLQAYRLGAPWAENTVTWSNQPAPAGDPATTQSGPRYREWTVTSQTRAMYADGNHGFLIRNSVDNGNGSREQVFNSREKGNDNPPRLVITFG